MSWFWLTRSKRTAPPVVEPQPAPVVEVAEPVVEPVVVESPVQVQPVDMRVHAVPGTSLHDALLRDGAYATTPPASRTSTSREGAWQISTTWFASGEIDIHISDADSNLLVRFFLAPGGSPAALEKLTRHLDRIPTDDGVLEIVVRSAAAGLWARRGRQVQLVELAALVVARLAQ